MIVWLHANAGTIVVCMILVVAVAAAIRCIYQNHKNGRGCSGGCGQCPMRGSCHKK